MISSLFEENLTNIYENNIKSQDFQQFREILNLAPHVGDRKVRNKRFREKV